MYLYILCYWLQEYLAVADSQQKVHLSVHIHTYVCSEHNFVGTDCSLYCKSLLLLTWATGNGKLKRKWNFPFQFSTSLSVSGFYFLHFQFPYSPAVVFNCSCSTRLSNGYGEQYTSIGADTANEEVVGKDEIGVIS